MKLLVKGLVLGDSLLTTLASDQGSIEPKILDLAVGDYVMSSDQPATAGSSAAKTYKNLDQLTKILNAAVSEVSGSAAAAADGGSSSQKKQKTADAAEGAAAASSSRDEPRSLRSEDPDPDYDPLRIGPPQRAPMRIGESKVVDTPFIGIGEIDRQQVDSAQS